MLKVTFSQTSSKSWGQGAKIWRLPTILFGAIMYSFRHASSETIVSHYRSLVQAQRGILRCVILNTTYKHSPTAVNARSTNVEKCILSIEFLSGALPVETCCGLRRSKIKYDSRTMKLFIQHVSLNFSWAINNGKLFFGRKAAPTRSGIWHIFLHCDEFYFGYSILNYCT